MKKVVLMRMDNFSSNLMVNTSKEKYISLKNLVKIYEALNCELRDVIELK